MVKPAANTPLAIPGLADAIEHEKSVRDADFLDVSISVEGFELVPMTFQHLSLLRLSGSPFVVGGTPSPAQLALFLWIMSPEFEAAQRSEKRKRFFKLCQKFMPPREPCLHTRWAMRRYGHRLEQSLRLATRIVDGCRAFVHDTFEEVPPRPSTVAFQPEYYSSAVSFCASLGREFGWAEAAVIKMPLRRVFQYNNEIRQHNDPKAVMFNPSDRIKRDWMNIVNRKN